MAEKKNQLLRVINFQKRKKKVSIGFIFGEIIEK